MAEATSGSDVRILKLILVPSLITLAVTILRVAGELQNWPAPFFVKQGGGGGAIVGISWLPIFFGIYFAFQGKWGTHYDALPPGYVSKGFASDFLNFAVFPQMLGWIAFTVLVGTLFGAVAAAIAQRRKPAVQAA